MLYFLKNFRKMNTALLASHLIAFIERKGAGKMVPVYYIYIAAYWQIMHASLFYGKCNGSAVGKKHHQPLQLLCA
jgi:hypothetical protein